ncbi:hypothetical protein C8R43DRAFT_15148 [Mycena crocata]|nr:hypothetical protein C8R43DRAFT_15148 [Mycena crocata]
MHYTPLLFLFVFYQLQLARASLFPTNPIANTTVTAGTEVQVTWIDTSRHPRLPEMGSLLNIDLCCKDGTNPVTLARKVSPMSRTHMVLIPENLTCSGLYVMIFSSAYPPMKIWTADFNIAPPLITDSTLPYTPQLDDANATHPQLTIVLPSATIVSDLAPTPKFAAATTVEAGPLPPGGGGGGGLNRVHSPNRARKGDDARFRLVFIVWPAVIGISMAL